jgi:hypothetical protein
VEAGDTSCRAFPSIPITNGSHKPIRCQVVTVISGNVGLMRAKAGQEGRFTKGWSNVDVSASRITRKDDKAVSRIRLSYPWQALPFGNPAK